jgi:hypothetical protein
MCTLQARGAIYVDRVPDAVHAKAQALRRAYSLIDAVEPRVGRSLAVQLSDAVSGIAGAYEVEITARLVAVVTAMVGTPAGVLVAPEGAEVARS